MKISYHRSNGDDITVEIPGEEVAAVVRQVPFGQLGNAAQLIRTFRDLAAEPAEGVGGTNDTVASEQPTAQRLLERGEAG